MTKIEGFKHELMKNRTLFLMLLPGVAFFIVFAYIPMAGSIVAFKQYNYRDGIYLSPWCGIENFRFFFLSGQAWTVTRNTVLYNTAFMITCNLFQIAAAIFFSEMASKVFKKIAQSMLFLPYFISWVVGGIMVYNLLNYEFGVLSSSLKSVGLDPIDFYGTPSLWKYILVGFCNWKWLGYGSVIYLAAIMGINVELYEAAKIDGAGVMQRTWHITLPLIKPTFIILLLLNVGRIFRGDFDMFYQIVGDSGNLFSATDVIDTFVFRALLRNNDFGMASASAFYQSVLCFVTIVAVNQIVRKIDRDYALY